MGFGAFEKYEKMNLGFDRFKKGRYDLGII